MQLTLREAAQQVGASKSALLRAVKAGRLSATRDEDGSYRVDPAELHRAYPPERLVPRSALQAAAGNGAGNGADGASPDAVEWRIRAFEVELKEVRARLEAELRRVDEIRQERDSWKTQAERLLLAAPIVTPAPQAATLSPATTSGVPIVSEPKRSAPASRGRSLWRWLRQTG